MPHNGRSDDRHDLLWDLWHQMTPAGRERAWASLTVEQRVECLTVMFGATELPNVEGVASA